GEVARNWDDKSVMDPTTHNLLSYAGIRCRVLGTFYMAELPDPRFQPRDYLLLTDRYIKDRIIFSDSPKQYGLDTYFGRKFFYKTQSGARIVASIPFLDQEQDTLETDDISLYPAFP